MLNSFSAFITALVLRARREEGQTMAEYGILIAVIALVVIAAAITFGTSLSDLFHSDAVHV